jgi:hypothetical protein
MHFCIKLGYEIAIVQKFLLVNPLKIASYPGHRFAPLILLILSFRDAMRTTAWIFVMVFIVVYLYAIIGTMFIGQNDQLVYAKFLRHTIRKNGR